MLHGYRVVELAVWVAGPGAGGVLADWGADVIKVEPPGGDPMRTVFGAVGVRETRVPPFELDNRGKRSVVLDLRTEEGLRRMDQLLATADVFLTNLRPDALERLGLEHESVRARHPRLVYAGVTGYGLEGPDRDRPGYDIGAFWARSSLAATIMPPGDDPPSLRSGMGDHITSITTVAGICAALLDRERTGEGRLVATSLLRTGIYCMGWDIGIYLRFGKLSSTRPRSRAMAPLINCYRAGDGKWFWLIGLEQDRHWPGVVAAIAPSELASDPRFASAILRRENAEPLIATLDEIFATRTRAEWTDRFDEHDVWWAPVQTIPEVIADPQAEAAGAWVDMTPPDGEPGYRAVASPVSFSDVDQRPGRVPALGEHTDEILASLPP
jgi:crotonobetainyl-CoA:carnitine CoA-transferase CaiB-like acyl-CoA transferase